MTSKALPPTHPPTHHTHWTTHPFLHTKNDQNTKQALEIAGDEQLSAVARDALPANTKTSKKAVELMGSTKVVTEKKALKRLGSEMSDSMKVLQIKTERKEQKIEESRRGLIPSAIVTDLSGEGAGGDGVDGVGAVGGQRPSSRIGSPGGFGSSTMARRATRLLTEVPKFISDMGLSTGSKGDLDK